MAITPAFLSGKSQGQRSLVGYSPGDHKDLDTTEHTRVHIVALQCPVSVCSAAE